MRDNKVMILFYQLKNVNKWRIALETPIPSAIHSHPIGFKANRFFIIFRQVAKCLMQDEWCVYSSLN